MEEEENKEEEKPTEKKLTYLDEVRKEKKELAGIRDELKEERVKLQELKTEEILSGKTEGGIIPPKPKEETDEEYANKVLEGTINPLQ